jgi:hypothetical protein
MPQCGLALLLRPLISPRVIRRRPDRHAIRIVQPTPIRTTVLRTRNVYRLRDALLIIGPILFCAALQRKRGGSRDEFFFPRYPFDPEEYPAFVTPSTSSARGEQMGLPSARNEPEGL